MDPTTFKIMSGYFGLRVVQQETMVIIHRLLVDLQERFDQSGLCGVFWRRGGKGNRNSRPFSQVPDRFGKIQRVGLHQKAEDIPPRTTAKTVKELLGLTDNKGRCLFMMKGTKTDIILATLPERKIMRDHIHNINTLLNPADGLDRNRTPHHVFFCGGPCSES